jgi:hypothetical protein
MPHGLPPAKMGGQGGNERISRAASSAMQPVTATITGGGLHSHSSTPQRGWPSSSGSEPLRGLHCALVLGRY